MKVRKEERGRTFETTCEEIRPSVSLSIPIKRERKAGRTDVMLLIVEPENELTPSFTGQKKNKRGRSL